MSLSRREFGGVLAGAAACVLAASLPGKSRAAPQTHQVQIRNFRFEPELLTIRAGDRVEWINRDVVPHTATARNGVWDTGNLATNERQKLTFEAPGHAAYFCAYHPNMVAEIVVEG